MCPTYAISLIRGQIHTVIKVGITVTDCAIIGLLVYVYFTKAVCMLDIQTYTCSIHENVWKTLYVHGITHMLHNV